LREIGENDKRIRVVVSEGKRGVFDKIESTLKETQGDYVVLLGENEMLSTNALWEVVELLNIRSDLDLIYSDEDRVDGSGKKRSKPWFKPDWSPEMLLSVNYFRPAIVHQKMFETIDYGESTLEDAYYWDLILQVAYKAKKVAHIPRVLCHVGCRSVNRKGVLKELAAVPAKQLERCGEQESSGLLTYQGTFRVVWPTENSQVSIVIPSRDNAKCLKRCIESLFERTEYTNFDVILIDNNSQEESTLAFYRTLLRYQRVQIISYDKPFNYSEANNLGAQYARGALLLFLNDDIEVIDSKWLEELVRWAERPEIGVVGAKLLYPDHSIQHAGIILGLGGHAGHVFYGVPEGEEGLFGSTEWYRNYLAVTGACMMIPRKVVASIGGFDEGYRLVFSDVEMCLRIVARGYRILYNPFARLIHHEGSTRHRFIPYRDMTRAFRDLKVYIQTGDPYFNPNLSYFSPYPKIAMREEDRLIQLDKIMARTGSDQ